MVLKSLTKSFLQVVSIGVDSTFKDIFTPMEYIPDNVHWGKNDLQVGIAPMKTTLQHSKKNLQLFCTGPIR